MNFISYFLLAIAQILDIILGLFICILIIRTVLSWINPDPFNPIVEVIKKITNPPIIAIRSRFPSVYGGIDLSPLAVFLTVIFLKIFLINSISQIASYLI